MVKLVKISGYVVLCCLYTLYMYMHVYNIIHVYTRVYKYL